MSGVFCMCLSIMLFVSLYNLGTKGILIIDMGRKTTGKVHIRITKMLYTFLVYKIAIATPVLSENVDDFSNFECTNCGKTGYCRSKVAVNSINEIHCYKHRMKLASENPKEGQFLSQLLKLCNFNLPEVQKKHSYMIYSNLSKSCDRSLISKEGGHFMINDMWNCEGGPFPYICETTPENLMAAQYSTSKRYFHIDQTTQNFSTCITTCQKKLHAHGDTFIPDPTLMLPEYVYNSLDRNKAYWLAWYVDGPQCGIIGVPGKKFWQSPVDDCSQRAFCICVSSVNLTSTPDSKAATVAQATSTDTLPSSTQCHSDVSATATSDILSVKMSKYSQTDIPSSLRTATISVFATILSTAASFNPASLSFTQPLQNVQYPSTSSASSSAYLHPTNTNVSIQNTQTSSHDPLTNMLYSSATPTLELNSFPASSKTLIEGVSDPVSPIIPTVISSTPSKSAKTTSSMTLAGGGGLFQSDLNSWVHVNSTEQEYRLTSREVGFCDARQTCINIGGKLSSPRENHLTMIIGALRLAKKAPTSLWINSPEKSCHHKKVPEKATVLLILPALGFKDDYSSSRHHGLCERNNNTNRPVIITEPPLVVTATPPKTTDWITYGKSDFFINRNQTSFQQAEEFCRQHLNASLLFYTNAIQYLDLSDDLSLSTGQFWIGVLPNENSSSPKCLQLNVENDNAKLVKIDCHMQSGSICSRCSNITDVLNDPKFLKLLEELTIDKTSTQKSQRRLKSVYEARKSATAVGSIGVAVFVTVFSIIALMDLSRLRNMFTRRENVKMIHFKDPAEVKKRGRSMSECRC